MKKKDILFATLPSRWSNHRTSLGLMYVSSYLKSKGYNNIIYDYPNSVNHKNYSYKHAFRDLIYFINKIQPKYLLFSVTSMEAYEAIKVCKKIKEKVKCNIVLGGPHVFARPSDFFESNIDYLIVGEGEITTYELIDYIEKNKDLKNVKGLIWKNSNRYISNLPRDLIKDINILPYPSYDKITQEKYFNINDGVIRGLPFKAAMVLSSRGCPFNCCFCNSPLIFGRKVRYRNIENLEGELKLLKKRYGIEAVWFVDDTFTANKKYVKKVCNLMKRLNLFWGCQARINCLDEGMIINLKKSGCLQLDFGIESGSDRILTDIIGKKFNVKNARKIIKLCHKHNMRVLTNFIIGFPTESYSEMKKTFKLAKETRSFFYNFNIATPLPNTKLYNMIGEDASIEEYDDLDFLGSEGAERFNKSKVKNINKIATNFKTRLIRIALFQSISHPLIYLKIFLKLNRRLYRFKFLLKRLIFVIWRSFSSRKDPNKGKHKFLKKI